MPDPEPDAIKTERRKGPDWLCHLFKWLALSAWLIFAVALVLSHYASPELNTGLVRYWELDIRDYWHPILTVWLIYLLWGCITLSVVSLSINRLRMNRNTDHLYINIVLLVATATGLLWYVSRQ